MTNPRGLFKRDDGKWAMERCTKCQRENYCMMVLDGICAWCGFDVNATEPKKTLKAIRVPADKESGSFQSLNDEAERRPNEKRSDSTKSVSEDPKS